MTSVDFLVDKCRIYFSQNERLPSLIDIIDKLIKMFVPKFCKIKFFNISI